MRIGRPVRVAFAGVAHSHPFADAENLRARGARLLSLWDPDDPAAANEFRRRFGVAARPDLDALLEERPDVVVATVRTPRAAHVSRVCTRARIPAFFNKTVAADERGLACWSAAAGAPRFTTSVLRFAPALLELARELRDVRVRAVDIVAQHDISAFLQPGRRWQDDPRGAGGTLVNIGIHAWEMLDVLLPGARARVLSATATKGTVPTASELLATVHAEVGETALAVTVSGVAGPDCYAVRALTDDGLRHVRLGTDPPALGYHGAADGILRLARTREPAVAESRTRAVYDNALAAARVARDAEACAAPSPPHQIGEHNGSASV